MKTKLQLIHDDGNKEINIFIHGYLKNSKNDFDEIMYQINHLELRGKVYVLNWISTKYIVKTSYPIKFSVSIGIISFVIDYLSMKYRAQNIGTNILRNIRRMKFSKTYPINLIGFSLGTLAIQYSLMYSYWGDLKLKNVILLGGAADNKSDIWKDCLDNIQGKIYNVYSKDDDILRLEIFATTIGRNPIKCKNKKIINKKLNLGHGDYMKNLSYIFDRIVPERRRSKNYFGDVIQCCPICKEDLIVKTNLKGNCHYCDCNFMFSPSDNGYYMYN